MSEDDWTRTNLGPGLRIADWLRIRNQLAPGKFDDQWSRAIAAIEGRFRARFLDPADAIGTLDSLDKGSFPEGRGFAIVALDCLLIEALFGYEAGERTGLEGTGTGDAFIKVLSKAEPFKKWFDQEGRAESFARAVRNGILHDGETREGWLVWKTSGTDAIVSRLSDRRLVLYRDEFHAAVTAYFTSYLNRLRDPTGVDAANLREKFKQRVNTLCTESDPAYLPPHVVARIAKRAARARQ